MDASGRGTGNARAVTYIVTPGYQDALGLRVRQGRLFTDADRASGTRAWVVNEEFARLYLPPQPLGYRFERTDRATVEIVAIVANVLKDGNDRQPQPEVYILPRDHSGDFGGRFELAIRTSGAPASAASAVRAIVQEMLPSAAVETVALSKRVAESVDQPRFAASVLAAFALLALMLASVGLYGVLSYGVSQRRRELGVRAALGASPQNLISIVVREGLVTASIGLAAGLAAAAALTRFMEGALFGVEPLDALSFAAAPVVLLLVAACACVLPASRAASDRSSSGVAVRIVPRCGTRVAARRSHERSARRYVCFSVPLLDRSGIRAAARRTAGHAAASAAAVGRASRRIVCRHQRQLRHGDDRRRFQPRIGAASMWQIESTATAVRTNTDDVTNAERYLGQLRGSAS